MKHIHKPPVCTFDFSEFDYETCRAVFGPDRPYDFTEEHVRSFQVSAESVYFKELFGYYNAELDTFHIKTGHVTIDIKNVENLRAFKNIVRKLYDHYKNKID